MKIYDVEFGFWVRHTVRVAATSKDKAEQLAELIMQQKSLNVTGVYRSVVIVTENFASRGIFGVKDVATATAVDAANRVMASANRVFSAGSAQ